MELDADVPLIPRAKSNQNECMLYWACCRAYQQYGQSVLATIGLTVQAGPAWYLFHDLRYLLCPVSG